MTSLQQHLRKAHRANRRQTTLWWRGFVSSQRCWIKSSGASTRRVVLSPDAWAFFWVHNAARRFVALGDIFQSSLLRMFVVILCEDITSQRWSKRRLARGKIILIRSKVSHTYLQHKQAPLKQNKWTITTVASTHIKSEIPSAHNAFTWDHKCLHCLHTFSNTLSVKDRVGQWQ